MPLGLLLGFRQNVANDDAENSPTQLLRQFFPGARRGPQ